MLENIKKIPYRAMNLMGGIPRRDAKPILTSLCRTLRLEAKKSFRILTSRSANLYPVHELHMAIDNLTNIDIDLRQHCRSKDSIGAESSLLVLNKQFEQTAKLLTSGAISNSIDAGEIVTRTLNLLFTAKQRVKQEFGVSTALDLNASPELLVNPKPTQPDRDEIPALLPRPTISEMVLSSTMLFQLRQSLFPAERMIVGAARKTAGSIRIEALFDVTGEASPIGVKADADRLGQALIAMAETGTYFGLWVHSHPGTGAGATHPSGIDLNQHADWLKHYSADLVSAIMVKDRHVRFWGKAVEDGTITLRIEGARIQRISEAENVYRLGS